MGEQTDTDPVRRYVVSSLTPQGFVEEGISYDYLIDHLYTAHEVVDETGVTVWQGDYASESFGEVNITTEVVTNNLRFPGQYADEESGLYYNYYSTYDSVVGRYMQSDPIGLDDGPNTYVYVKNNPISKYDNLGLQGQQLCMGRMPTPTPDCWGRTPSLGACLLCCQADTFPHSPCRAACYAEFGGAPEPRKPQEPRPEDDDERNA